ncbi:uncharacterized protein E5676_scaffold143G00290 [Cucumis melo var. makuwa]|uniref:CACTA en-spm transposon protein n=1 Tax=Cucumis melo var. makuwa TaxID=1194695 RepID=A0A5D3BZ75_CUCMM|nr:uncharacterized protein E5676_scaffold143G00290 [Cucumis melo var. makuwa]
MKQKEMASRDKRVETDDVLRHPADAEGWKHFDSEFSDFASDPRNVRLGLASDGFNPFGQMSTSYSMWLVVLLPYNLSPWKCMKETNFFMSLLIPSPKSFGREIDVYLQPLIEELKELWSIGTFSTTTISAVHSSSGSKSFLQRQYELAERKGESVDHVELFQEAHVRAGTFVSQAAEDAHNQMLELQSQPTPEGSQPLSEDEICDQVLGRRPGYSKSLGWEPKPKARRTASASSSSTSCL